LPDAAAAGAGIQQEDEDPRSEPVHASQTTSIINHDEDGVARPLYGVRREILMIAIRLIASFSVVLIIGCASVPAPMAEYRKQSDDAKTKEAESTKRALEQDFQDALELCDAQMAAARESFYGSGKVELTIASIGIVAGSIIVPALAAKAAAAKSAIAAWGGVSGAANAAQYTLQQKGVSASRLGVVYEATRSEIQAATEDFAKATKNSQRIIAVTKLSVACRYPRLPVVVAPEPAGSGATDSTGSKKDDKKDDKKEDKTEGKS
jgi:hypothetical protein